MDSSHSRAGVDEKGAAPSGTKSTVELLHHALDLRREGANDGALTIARRAVQRSPNSERAQRVLALCLLDVGNVDEATPVLSLLLEKNPLHLKTIRLLRSVGRPPKIDPRVSDAFLASTAKDPASFLQAGRYLCEGEHFEGALSYFEQGLEGPADEFRDIILEEKGLVLEHLDRPLEALAAYAEVRDKSRRAVRRGEARCLYHLGDFVAAEKILRESDSFEKDILPVLYSKGDIRGAHRYYRTRLGSRLIADVFEQNIAPEDIHIRSGRYLDKSGFIVAEGGVGDEIRLAAIYEELRHYFRDLTVTCDPRLKTMLERSMPSVRFLPVPRYRSRADSDLSDRRNLPEWRLYTCLSDEAVRVGRQADFACSTLDALSEFRGEYADFPRPPHLTARGLLDEMESIPREVEHQAKRLQVGLAWRSILRSASRNRHYFDVEELAPLADLEADFWILQPNVSSDERDKLEEFLNLVDLEIDMKDDFEGQATVMSKLDFVISPLTSTGELAGALGVPTLFLAPVKDASWRQGVDGRDVWYKDSFFVYNSQMRQKLELVHEAAQRISLHP